MSRGLVEQFFDYGVDHRRRVIYLGSPKNDGDNDVSPAMAEQTIKGLISLDASSDQPIKLIINTPGGDVEEGMAIYDAISICRSHVTGLVFGQACSMGSVILQACDERVLASHSVIMIHNGTLSVDHTVENVERYVELDKKCRHWMEDIYLKRIKEVKPRYTRRQLKELLKIDTYFLPKQAIELGLADKVME